MKQILFVDDKPAIGKVLSVYLGKENELVYFEDPVRAIEWLNEGNEPALIISDIRMPKMTGSEILGSGFEQVDALGGTFFTGKHHNRNVLEK